MHCAEESPLLLGVENFFDKHTNKREEDKGAMAEAVVHNVRNTDGITCHAWNKDRSMVALCPNSASVLIFKVPNIQDANAKWELLHELKEHDQVVTGIDWAPNSNLIVTASQDRNAYVWRLENNEWKPSLVILRVNRAATVVKWSPDESKFAVGSGARCVPVCHYDPENSWWVSKIIKKHKSTVLSLAWHPTLPLLATGSSDFKCRVFSAFVKDVDPKEARKNPYKEDAKLAFGELLCEFQSAGWVHSVAWSPSGKLLGFCGHDSTVGVATVQGDGSPVQILKLRSLPFRTLHFLSEGALVAAGHELNPVVFILDSEWKVAGKLDKEKEAKPQAQQSTAKAAFAIFKNQDKKASTGASASANLPTKHQNSVSCLQSLSPAGGDVTSFTTSGLDGLVVHWSLGSLESALSQLSPA